jgi:hypothetical protein
VSHWCLAAKSLFWSLTIWWVLTNMYNSP